MLKAADRIILSSGAARAPGVLLNMLRSSLHFKVIARSSERSIWVGDSCSPAQARSCLINGSFETGDFIGWTASGNFTFTQVVSRLSFLVPALLRRERYVTAGPIGSEGFARVFLIRREKVV